MTREERLSQALKAATRLRSSFVDFGEHVKMLAVPRPAAEEYDLTIRQLTEDARKDTP